MNDADVKKVFRTVEGTGDECMNAPAVKVKHRVDDLTEELENLQMESLVTMVVYAHTCAVHGADLHLATVASANAVLKWRPDLLGQTISAVEQLLIQLRAGTV